MTASCVCCFSESFLMASRVGVGQRNSKISSSDQPLGSSFFASSSSTSLLGSGAILNFGAFDHDDNGDELLDEYLNQPEKKRRLSMEQVQFLEKCFMADNKLEPERKIQIANELGLQPRQIAVWFQNRRARWKTRRLETDYESLHRSYKRLKAAYDNLLHEHEKLKAEVFCLKINGDAEDATRRAEEEAWRQAISNNNNGGEDRVSTMASVQGFHGTDLQILGGGICSNPMESSALEADHSNLIHGMEDELLSPETKAEASHYLSGGSGFCYGFPREDSAFNFWSC